MSVGNNRASIMAFKEEVTAGTLVSISAATQFVPLRPGFGMEYKAEELTNDELQSDIGMSKSAKGKESVEGSHEAFLKHSGTEGVAPALGLLYKSIMGGSSVVTVERSTTVGCTISKLVVGAGLGVNFYKGQALLIKLGTGYYIRNVKRIDVDDIHLNFNLPTAPGSGIALGKAVTYLPQSSGHPTFSAWLYQGNGYSVNATAGCTVTELTAEFAVNQFASTSFKYEGIKFYMNPIEITATSKYIDFTDDSGTYAAEVTAKWYRNPAELADALAAAMNVASADDYTVVYNSITGKFTIASATTVVMSLLWNTGVNAVNSIGTKLGFLVATNDVGALTYTSDNALTYGASYTPSYDVTDSIVLKDAEFVIGDSTNLIARSAQKVTMKLSKKTEDADGITEETGTREKVAVSREVMLELEMLLEKHDVSLFDHLLNNDTVSAMLNCGPKSGGNWVAGKCFNLYMPNAVITGFSPSGENFILAKVSVRGFIDNDYKDIFVNFI